MNTMQVFILSLLVLTFSFANVWADDKDDEEMFFDKRQSYNIYLSAGSEYYDTVIEDVQIVRFQEIAGKSFLVVKSKGLKISEEEGFILFDSITAILPERNFRVREIQRTYIHKE